MNKRKKLLFSKNEKTDKYTETGNLRGAEVSPKNKETESSQNNNKNNKEDLEKGNQKKGSKNQMEKTSNFYLKKNIEPNNDLTELIKENNNLNKQLKDLEKEMEQLRKEFTEIINNKDKEYNQINSEIKKLSDEFNKKVEILKNHEKNLKIENKNNSNKKSEEEMKKEINIIEAQIKIYEDKEKIYKKEYELLKEAEKEENKENDLLKKLNDLNMNVASLEKKVDNMRITSEMHQNCQINNEKLLEEYNKLNKSYQYALKRANNYDLSEISDSNVESKDRKNKEEDENEDGEDNIEKAISDQNNFLPKIKNLNLSVTPIVKLDIKIIKKNKIGLNKNESNANYINVYKKISNEFNDNKGYLKEGNKNIRINNVKTKIKTEENYLFKKQESNILHKVLPENLMNSYKDKFNDILKQRKDMKKKFINDSNQIKKDNLKNNFEKEFNNLKVKEMNQKHIKLNKEYRRLIQNMNKMKKKIKEIENQIQKQEVKIKMKEKEKKRIENYFKDGMIIKDGKKNL